MPPRRSARSLFVSSLRRTSVLEGTPSRCRGEEGKGLVICARPVQADGDVTELDDHRPARRIDVEELALAAQHRISRALLDRPPEIGIAETRTRPAGAGCGRFPHP